MNTLTDDHLPSTLNALQQAARAPNAEALSFFEKFEQQFRTLSNSELFQFEGQYLNDIVKSELSRALHHVTPKKASSNPLLNQFMRMLFDGLNGKGAHAKARGTNGPSDLLAKFRFYSRQPGYTGSFGPLRTKGDVRRVGRFDERVVAAKKCGSLTEEELTLLKEICRFTAKFEGLSSSDWIEYFNEKCFFASGIKYNTVVGVTIWVSSLVLCREVGAFSEDVAPYIAIDFAETNSDRSKKDPINLGSARILKRFTEAARVYNYDSTEVSKVLAGEADEEGLFARTWVYLIKNNLYSKHYLTFKKSLRDWFHPFSHKNSKVSTRWSVAEDKFLKIAIQKGLKDGVTTFSAMTLAAAMFACRSIGLDFTEPGFFSPATRDQIAQLGITYETPLKEMKRIFKADSAAEKTLKLDEVDLTPPAATPASSTTAGKKRTSRKRAKKEEENEEEEEQPSKKKAKPAKAPAKGRALACDGGSSKHGARVRKALD
ncbi:uncharacterized protein JCM6883_002098 [Sporobolomyces salmoneus]|uniref:uncharacterized protein n=1 Tax=Sporobolomyces salmoneus TaxID=183962 RepID=UPI00317288EF